VVAARVKAIDTGGATFFDYQVPAR